jgi:hypothetical protein
MQDLYISICFEIEQNRDNIRDEFPSLLISIPVSLLFFCYDINFDYCNIM